MTFSVSMVMWSCGMLANGQLSKRLPLRVCFAIGLGLVDAYVAGSLPLLAAAVAVRPSIAKMNAKWSGNE